MKRIFGIFLPVGLILMLRLPVSAEGGAVTALSANAMESSVTVSGSTSGVNAAVAVQVLDGSGNVLAMESFVVMGNAFSGRLDSLVLTPGASYTVRAADYDGGTWKKTTATAAVPTFDPEDTSDNRSDDDSDGGAVPGAPQSVNERIDEARPGSTVTVTGVTTLSNGEMRKLAERANMTLVMEYTYEGKNYKVTIPAGKAVVNDIPWYGPLYLAAHYGNGAGADEAETVYTIKKSDTLTKIANANGITLTQLLEMNPDIKNPNRIYPGQKIVIKHNVQISVETGAAEYYKIQKGDYLYKIAAQNQITYAKLIDLNPGLAKQKFIFPGQKLRVK